MKKIILTLSLVICALLVIWGCTKSSNNNETTTQTKNVDLKFNNRKSRNNR